MAQRRCRPALQPLGHPEVGLALVFVVDLADLLVTLSCVEVANVLLRMKLNEAGARLIKLHAQEYIRDLYAAEGYEQISEVDYEDEGQPHLWMAKRL